MSNVSFEIDGDQVIIRHDGSDLGTVAAMRRAIEAFNKSVDGDRPEGFDPGDEDETGETPEERRERRRRLIAEADKQERERSRAETEAGVAPNARARKVATMVDFDTLSHLIKANDDNLIATIKKRHCGLAVLGEYVTKGLGQQWSESQVTQIINDHYGADAVKKMTEQSAEGALLRKALQKANHAHWNANRIV
jgi:hypothetical protein